MREDSDDPLYLIGDHLGSTSLVIDSIGQQVAKQTYLPFGEDWGASTNDLPTDFTFTGQREAAEIGLMYYVARWYDSEIGHFIQADTIVPGEGNPQAYNRFSYTGYNPTRYSDPTGHGIFDTVADFVTGVVTEGAKNFWWFIPQAQEDLAPSHSESTAMLVGRVVADVAGVIGGVNAIISGGGMMASGGAACVLTLGAACAIVPEALVAGAVVATAGASMVVGSVTGAVDTGVALYENFSDGTSSNHGPNKPTKYPFSRQKPKAERLQHIFENRKHDHRLDPVVEYYGDQENAFNAVFDAYVNEIMSNGQYNNQILNRGITIQVGQFDIYVQGNLFSNGRISISDFWIPK